MALRLPGLFIRKVLAIPAAPRASCDRWNSILFTINCFDKGLGVARILITHTRDRLSSIKHGFLERCAWFEDLALLENSASIVAWVKRIVPTYFQSFVESGLI